VRGAMRLDGVESVESEDEGPPGSPLPPPGRYYAAAQPTQADTDDESGAEQGGDDAPRDGNESEGPTQQVGESEEQDSQNVASEGSGPRGEPAAAAGGRSSLRSGGSGSVQGVAADPPWLRPVGGLKRKRRELGATQLDEPGPDASPLVAAGQQNQAQRSKRPAAALVPSDSDPEDEAAQIMAAQAAEAAFRKRSQPLDPADAALAAAGSMGPAAAAKKDMAAGLAAEAAATEDDTSSTAQLPTTTELFSASEDEEYDEENSSEDELTSHKVGSSAATERDSRSGTARARLPRNGGASPGMDSNASRSDLLDHIAALNRTNRRLLNENERLRKQQAAAVLSPALYTVHGQKQVLKMRLGRTASISTRQELTRLACTSNGRGEAGDDEDFVERMANLIRPETLIRSANYLKTEDFADRFIDLCERAAEQFSSEPRVLELESPMYIFGDLHGNLEDLQFFADNIWPMGMNLTAGKFLFLGDYVDRGAHGIELVAYLFAQKLLHPDKIFMIRGNHETRSVNGWEGFYGQGSFIAQCKTRFGDEKGFEVWERCNRAFDCLPLASIVDACIFCVHGGIPCPIREEGGDSAQRGPDRRIVEIKRIPCPIDIQHPSEDNEDEQNALAFSLLWADPADPQQESLMEDSSGTGFWESARGGGTVVFGNRAVLDFLEQNRLAYIMRAHEATANGVAVCKSAKVLTVFSTSKDHGCGGDAKCGCFLVDRKRIQAITRSATYSGGFVAGPPQPHPSYTEGRGGSHNAYGQGGDEPGRFLPRHEGGSSRPQASVMDQLQMHQRRKLAESQRVPMLPMGTSSSSEDEASPPHHETTERVQERELLPAAPPKPRSA